MCGTMKHPGFTSLEGIRFLLVAFGLASLSSAAVIANLAQGDLGVSFRTKRPVLRDLLDRFVKFDGYDPLRRRVQGYFELDLAATDYRSLAEFGAFLIDADTVVIACIVETPAVATAGLESGFAGGLASSEQIDQAWAVFEKR